MATGSYEESLSTPLWSFGVVAYDDRGSTGGDGGRNGRSGQGLDRGLGAASPIAERHTHGLNSEAWGEPH
jgi:hypothetical protein